MTTQKGGWDYFQENKAGMGDASGNAVTDSAGNPAVNVLTAGGATTATSRTLFDFTDDTTALSATGAPTTANIQTITDDATGGAWTSAEKVTGVLCNFHANATVAVGIVPGCYVTFNYSNKTTDLTDGAQRYWVANGVPRYIDFGPDATITTVAAVAMCSVDCQLDLEPF